MKTYKQILERTKNLRKNDPDMVMTFTSGDYYELLSYDDLKEMDILKSEVTKEHWEKESRKEISEEYIISEIANYLQFAFDKATGQRGISSSRSIMHFCNWLWMIEDHELLAFTQDDNNYGLKGGYGIVILRKIREKYKDFITRDKKEFLEEYGDY